MSAWSYNRAYTTEVPIVRLGRIATKRRNSFTAHRRRLDVMAVADSIDRFTPSCGNAVSCVRFLDWFVRCSPRSRSDKNGGYTTISGAGSTSVIGPVSSQTGHSRSRPRRAEGPALAMIEKQYWQQPYNLTDQDSSSSNAFLSFKSAVSNRWVSTAVSGRETASCFRVSYGRHRAPEPDLGAHAGGLAHRLGPRRRRAGNGLIGCRQPRGWRQRSAK